MEIKEINGYIESLYKSIPVTRNTDIRVLTSERKQTETTLIDIRKYSLYGNAFDGIKRPTKKGIKFKLNNIKDIIYALIMILINYDMLERDKGSYIVKLLDEYIENK